MEIDGITDLKLVNVCSNSYGLIPIKDILDKFEEILSAKYNFKVRYRHWNNCRFYVDYVITGIKGSEGEEIALNSLSVEASKRIGADKLYPRIRLYHSYDSSARYGLLFGFLRLVCKNGMTAIVFEKQSSKKHYKSLLKEIKNSAERIERFITGFQDHALALLGLANTEYPDAAMFDVTEESSFDLMLKSVLEKVGMKKQFDMIKLKVYEEMNMLQIEFPNNWLLYNGVNYQLNYNYDTLRMSEQARMEVDQKLIMLLKSDNPAQLHLPV